MTFRPYPNVDRAMKQLARHYPDPPAPAVEMRDCLRPMAASFARLRVNARRAIEQGPSAGGYVLSTRRLGVVSAGS